MQVDKVLLVALAFVSAIAARNVRCPPEIAANSVFPNRISPTKFFRCTSLRLLEDLECNDGELFDPDMLICHNPVPGRCGCPETTTTSCPCPTDAPCPQDVVQHNIEIITQPPNVGTLIQQPNLGTIIQQPNLGTIIQQPNVDTIVKACENCVSGDMQTRSPGFLITPLPVLSYDKFGIRDVPPAFIIVTDPPPPPC